MNSNSEVRLIQRYARFLINGSIIGIIAWVFQLEIYRKLGGNSTVLYALASALTYLPLIVINFLIQRTIVFNSSGVFLRFVTANIAIMLIVSVLSPICSQVINHSIASPWGERTGFAVAALLGSIPSFIINHLWVFRKTSVYKNPGGIS